MVVAVTRPGTALKTGVGVVWSILARQTSLFCPAEPAVATRQPAAPIPTVSSR